MAQIIYRINSGTPNFIASILPAVAPDNVHTEVGVYSFDDIPEGIYTIHIVDDAGCYIDLVKTTTGYTTTTTSTTTVTTTTTTSICGLVIGIIDHESDMPEFELVDGDLIYNEIEDRYELSIDYKTWLAQAFAPDCGRIEFLIYDEDNNYVQTITHDFDTESPNVWTKPVDTITEELNYNPLLFVLTVNNGTGDSSHKEFDVVSISATIPEGYYFDSWTDPDNIVTDVNSADTTVTMLAQPSSVTATFLPYRTLTITSGTAVEGTVANIKYGYLYNWYSINNAKNLANTGWHIATYTDGTDISAVDNTMSHFRETGTTYWAAATGTNTRGFNGRGAGNRIGGTFGMLKLSLELALIYPPFPASVYHAVFQGTDFAINGGSPADGCSVRLVKDSTILTDGQTGIYVGNDGKVYNTICIGTKEWLSENLAETKYRDGTVVPTVTVQADWQALITGAKCAYNNDESNV